MLEKFLPRIDFDSYEDLECNFAHCYYSKNIVKAVGEEIDFLNNKILLKF